jgi:holin-like protein
MKWGRMVLQVGLITLFVLLGNQIERWTHLPIPGSIFGMVFLFLGLKVGWIKLKWVEAGSRFLLGEMLLFFIPPVVGIIQYENLMKVEGFQFFLVILISTMLVMLSTGGVAELLARKRGDVK